MNSITNRCPFTLNTTRICGLNIEDFAITVSKISFTNMRPNSVILVNENEVFDGIAATPLVHFPINAPILYTNSSTLSKETLMEIQRLSPAGYKGIQVFLVGNISDNVEAQLNYCGLRTHHIAGCNHYETACKIPKIRETFEDVLIMSGEDFSEGIVSTFWSAHHGDPILFVQRDKVPYCTLDVIRRMKDINVYIIGSTQTVSRAVEKSLSKLNNIKSLHRVDGNNPYEISVNFAKYKDPKTEFGWNRNYRDGHAFTFATLSHPMEIVASVVFAHMGKHTPLLLIRKDIVPSVIANYIESVKPIPPKNMPRPPFTHGFILGSSNQITYNTQVRVDTLLSIEHEM